MSFPARTVRFGPFQLDLRAAELQHNGTKTKLPEQPFQVLCELVEHPGEVVTREELRQRLWRSDTFVDFEHGLNTAVKRLREILGDSAENPRYIETLPRHGYRLMVPVDRPGPVASAISEPSLRRRSIWLVVSVAVVAAVVAGLLWRQRLLERFHPAKIESLAVLPLENLSGNPDEAYFADGMTDALITELGKVTALRVISRQSVMQYKGTTKPVPQIAQELHVDAVVEGSALRAGDKVRITTQLVQAAPERHLWSESYERNLRDVIGLQREISQAIVWEIQGKLTSQQRIQLVNAPQVNPEAYEDYLRGRYHYQRWPLGFDQATIHFQKAIEKDPNYAPAYSGLALCYGNLGFFHPPKEVFPKARAAAMKALEIDDAQAEAHAALGFVKVAYDWDWPGAERELKRAIELNPNNSDNRSYYVYYLTAMRRFDEAIAEAKRVRALDPLSIDANRVLAWAYMMARHYDDAIDQFKRTLEFDPNYSAAQERLAISYTLKGMYPEALAQYQKMGVYDGDDGLAYLYAVSGQRSKALRIIEEVKHLAAQRYFDPCYRAIPYAGLNDKDNAMKLLTQAYEQRSPELSQVRVSPFLDNLRSDPRFQDLVRRMNFPP